MGRCEAAPQQRRISAFSLAASAALATIKISVGLSRADRLAVVSDGVESASDCVTSGLVTAGPVDRREAF